MPAPLLSAVLVVRDEAEDITGCLDALAPLADETVVYDTGSSDDTVALARAAGAFVVQGWWDGDFARARNDAAAEAGGQWLLIVDADEIVVADPAALRAMLGAGQVPDCFSVELRNVGPDGPEGSYSHRGDRLVRRGAARWEGRVHERVRPVSGEPLRTGTMPAHVLGIEHHGYADPEALRRKGTRNADLAEAELAALLRLRPHDGDAIATVLLHLGRSLIGAGRRQDAVDTFETLRELAPGTPQWAEATDFLARLLLGGGHDEAVLLLSDQLREAGTDPRYCDWLRAQALAQLGAPQDALELVREIHELVDPAGRSYDVGQVLEVRALLARLTGHQDEALRSLLSAMAEHGRIRGRGAQLLELWAAATADAPTAADRSAEALAALLRESGTRHLPAVGHELGTAPSPGPAVAAALGHP